MKICYFQELPVQWHWKKLCPVTKMIFLCLYNLKIQHGLWAFAQFFACVEGSDMRIRHWSLVFYQRSSFFWIIHEYDTGHKCGCTMFQFLFMQHWQILLVIICIYTCIWRQPHGYYSSMSMGHVHCYVHCWRSICKWICNGARCVNKAGFAAKMRYLQPASLE